jgi:hypothetical protein
LFIGSPRVTHYARTAGTWPAAPDAAIARYDYHDLYIVACTARQPPAVPGLINRRLIRTAGYVMDVVHDLLVIPAGGKLGLAGIAHPMPMATSAARVTVENVPSAFGSDAERI